MNVGLVEVRASSAHQVLSQQWGALCVGIVVGRCPNFRRFLSPPPHTPAGFGLERSLMLMIKWDLGFFGGLFFVQLVIYLFIYF